MITRPYPSPPYRTGLQRRCSVAVRAYLQHGGGSRGAQAAWLAIRRLEPQLRAPQWDEALWLNTARRRSYRSPLGDALGVVTGAYGQHCTEYPRTVESLLAAEEATSEVLVWLEQEACAVV